MSTTSRGLPAVMASMSGFRLDTGIRASMISTTMSTFFRSASICRRVLVMCPGYHWIFMGSPPFLSPALRGLYEKRSGKTAPFSCWITGPP